ncbi:MAG: hypothetical protein ABIF10_01655, partial [Candidatus Woesearchaeota archaeon]
VYVYGRNATSTYTYVYSATATGGTYNVTYAFANDTSGNLNASRQYYLNFTVTGANTAPTVGRGPTIRPILPNTTSVLNCTFAIFDSEAGDTLYANYTWFNKTAGGWTAKFKGRISVTNGTNTSIRLKGAGNLTKGRNWNCSILPYDSTVYGTPKSVNVTVKNWPVRNGTRTITPSTAYTTTKLSGNITCVDLDPADTLTAWCRLYNGSNRYGSTTYRKTATNNTKTNVCNVTAAMTAKGETWRAELWCGDGTANTTKWNASVTVLNIVPVIAAGPSIRPTLPNVTSSLNCSFRITDVDKEANLYANFTWYNRTGGTWTAKFKGRISVTNGTNASIRLTGSGNLTKGRNWNCSIKAYDSTDYSAPKSRNVTIKNWPVRNVTSTLTPTTAYTTTKLSGNITCVDLDVGDTLTAWCRLYNGTKRYGTTTYQKTATNNTKTNVCNVSATWTKKNENWTAELWCGDATANSTKTNKTVMIGNIIPVINTPIITPANPSTHHNLSCSFNITDIDKPETLYANYTWYNRTGASWTAKFKGRVQVLNGTRYNLNLSSANTTSFNRWNCSIRAYDGTNYSAPKSAKAYINNTVPPKANLSYPLQNDSFFTERAPTFNWTSITDPDGDSITYHFQLANDHAFSSVVNNTGGITTHNYSYSKTLTLSQTYYWRVLANDSINASPWSSIWNFTIQPYIAVSLFNSTMQFGTMSLNDENDTTDASPAPFKLMNDGNTESNISISSTALWQSVGNNSEYYQYKARQAEAGAYGADSQEAWRNLTATNTTLLRSFNWTNTKDEAFVDIKVKVPQYEQPASRSSIVTFFSEES